MIDMLVTGFSLIANPQTLFLIAIGTVVGILVGCIPGFSTTMALVLALPFSFGMSSVDGLALMLGIMTGGLAGGLISAILLGIPGTAAAVVTTFDGFVMAQNGEPGRALAIGTWASFLGGIIGAFLLMFCMPVLADAAVRFGPWEYFSMVLFGLTVICSLAKKSMIKGLMAGIMGLMLANVGPDPMDGSLRFDFGNTYLSGGFNYLAILIGLFSYPQLMAGAEASSRATQDFQLNRDLSFSTLKVLKSICKSWSSLIVASGVGVFFGALPGVGAASATFVSYDQCRKLSWEGKDFGKGTASGIVASEACNNALGGGSLIPAMALGIPGDAMTAVMLGALILHGIQPGPMLIIEQADLVYSIFAAYLVANVVMLLLQLYGVRVFVYLTKVRHGYLVATILVLCAVGSFALQNRFFDMWVVFFAGLIGYVLTKNGFPLAPVVLGTILGPIAETNFRRALMTDSDPMLFLTRPISGVFIAISILAIVVPIARHMRLTFRSTSGVGPLGRTRKH